MWIIDLTFLQESASVFLNEFINKYYKVYTHSGKEFLIVNSKKNYPHLVGIRQPHLQRLGGSEFLFDCIINNDTSLWDEAKKKTFYKIYPKGKAKGLNDIKITFFPMMPELFVHNNYVISVNYNKNNSSNQTSSFDTEVIISDFNQGMNIGMRQRDEGSFGFNSWRVEMDESAVMQIYSGQEVDLIKKIEQYENDVLVNIKDLELSEKNLWRLSRLHRNYKSVFLKSKYLNQIIFLSQYNNSQYSEGIHKLRQVIKTKGKVKS